MNNKWFDTFRTMFPESSFTDDGLVVNRKRIVLLNGTINSIKILETEKKYGKLMTWIIYAKPYLPRFYYSRVWEDSYSFNLKLKKNILNSMSCSIIFDFDDGYLFKVIKQKISDLNMIGKGIWIEKNAFVENTIKNCNQVSINHDSKSEEKSCPNCKAGWFYVCETTKGFDEPRNICTVCGEIISKGKRKPYKKGQY